MKEKKFFEGEKKNWREFFREEIFWRGKHLARENVI